MHRLLRGIEPYMGPHANDSHRCAAPRTPATFGRRTRRDRQEPGARTGRSANDQQAMVELSNIRGGGNAQFIRGGGGLETAKFR